MIYIVKRTTDYVSGGKATEKYVASEEEIMNTLLYSIKTGFNLDKVPDRADTSFACEFMNGRAVYTITRKFSNHYITKETIRFFQDAHYIIEEESCC